MRPTTTHLIILLVVVLLLFGVNRLPALAKSMGQSLKIFKSEVKDLRDDDDKRPAGAITDAPDTGATDATVSPHALSKAPRTPGETDRPQA